MDCREHKHWRHRGHDLQLGHTMWAIKTRVLERLGLADIRPPSAVLYALRDREKLTDARTLRQCGLNSGSHLYLDVSQCVHLPGGRLDPVPAPRPRSATGSDICRYLRAIPDP